MNILCEIFDRHICDGWRSAFQYSGHNFFAWNIAEKSAFDAFGESEPDLFITTEKNSVTSAVKKCLQEWEDTVLVKCEENFPAKSPLFRYATDSFQMYYEQNQDEKYALDVIYVGDYTPEIDEYIRPLCKVDFPHKVNIFGKGDWPFPQYLGEIDDNTKRKLYRNSKISIATFLDPNKYDIQACGGRLFFLYPEGIGKTVVDCYNDEYDGNYRLGKIDYIQKGHTYLHRVKELLIHAGFIDEAEEIQLPQ